MENISLLIRRISQNENEAPKQESCSLEILKHELDELLHCKEKVSEVLEMIFQVKVPKGSEFYEKIGRIPRYLNYSDIGYQLMGLLWKEAYRQLSPKEKISFLEKWTVDNKKTDFWSFIRTLPFFLDEVLIPDNFAAHWFLDLGNKVKNDLGGNGFYKGLEIYTQKAPEAAFKIMKQYYAEGLTAQRLQLASIILGILRSHIPDAPTEKKKIDQWAHKLLTSPRTEDRICYHKSWIFSYERGEILTRQLESVLNRALKGMSEERDEAFNILNGCLMGQSVNQEIIDFSFDWLKNHVSAELSSNAKYSIIDLIGRLSYSHNNNYGQVDINEADNILLSIQPIPYQDSGTWNKIEIYLVDRLKFHKESFIHILSRLAQANSEVFFQKLKNHELDYLISELAKSTPERYISEVLFSGDSTLRHVGLILSYRIPIKNFSSEIVEGISNKILKLVLKTISQRSLEGEGISRILLLLEPLFKRKTKDLKKVFESELTIQAISYPKACLETWKEVKRPPALLKRAIKEADQYFGNKKQAWESPANSFSFPGLHEAAQKGAQEWNREVRRGMEEKSVLSNLFPRINLIYGELVSHIEIDNITHLSDPIKLTQHSQSMEFSRLEAIDPEAMFLKHLSIVHEINVLENEVEPNE